MEFPCLRGFFYASTSRASASLAALPDCLSPNMRAAERQLDKAVIQVCLRTFRPIIAATREASWYLTPTQKNIQGTPRQS